MVEKTVVVVLTDRLFHILGFIDALHTFIPTVNLHYPFIC